MEKDLNEFRNLIYFLKNRPAMVFGKIERFLAYQYFVDGYMYKWSLCNNHHINWDFSRFVNKKEIGLEISNISWSSTFEKKYPHLNDEEKIKIFIDLLENFMRETYNIEPVNADDELK
ncbi:MAG: hypothetical protein JST87_17140 [Bacteroidetes bacterium]|nr:hypothetical protein [Bacteroidota bacterium]